MLDRMRQMRISLAAKCQLLYGSAVALIIFAALWVPWQRMESLTEQIDDRAAAMFADAAVLDHIAHQQALIRASASATQPALADNTAFTFIMPHVPGTIAASDAASTQPNSLPAQPAANNADPGHLAQGPATQPSTTLTLDNRQMNRPRLISAARALAHVDQLTPAERAALRRFISEPNRTYYGKRYDMPDGDYGYRYSRVLNVNQPACAQCHTPSQSGNVLPTTGNGALATSGTMSRPLTLSVEPLIVPTAQPHPLTGQQLNGQSTAPLSPTPSSAARTSPASSSASDPSTAPRPALALADQADPDSAEASDSTDAPLPTTQASLLANRPEFFGMITVDIPSQVPASQRLLNRIFLLTAGLLAGSLAVLVFYYVTTRIILQPMRVLQETAEKVSQGDLNIRSDISTGDEFQQLSETFNIMLTNLKESQDQLRSINRSLDLKLNQLAETNVALYESNRLKSEFLANVSHELRTPLNSILGFADLLKDAVAIASDGKPARYVQNILTSGKNLLELINDLLDLAKIEAGRMDVRSEPLSLGDLFEGLTSILKPLAESNRLTLWTSVDTDVPIMHTDPAKLQQVLYNFLSNAIKFSPAGARIDLKAQRENDATLRLTVTDRGPGIEPSKQHEIFEKFRQIDGSVTRQHSGTGLGLAISKELTHLLGGSIGVDSTPGEGATFWVILPIKIQARTTDIRSASLFL